MIHEVFDTKQRFDQRFARGTPDLCVDRMHQVLSVSADLFEDWLRSRKVVQPPDPAVARVGTALHKATLLEPIHKPRDRDRFNLTDDGKLVLRDVTVRDAMHDLYRWYGLDISIRDSLTLDRKVSLEATLESTKEVIAAAQRWARQLDAKKVADAHHLLEALWLHQWHNVVNEPLLMTSGR